MIRFEVEHPYRVPADVLARWWMDYGEGDTKFSPELLSRRAERVDATHVRLVSESQRGKRKVGYDGIVTVEGPRAWTYRAEITLDGRPFGQMTNALRVTEEAGGGSRIHGTWEIRGRTLFAKVALPLLKGSLRKERERAYDGFATALEAEGASPR